MLPLRAKFQFTANLLYMVACLSIYDSAGASVSASTSTLLSLRLGEPAFSPTLKLIFDFIQNTWRHRSNLHLRTLHRVTHLFFRIARISFDKYYATIFLNSSKWGKAHDETSSQIKG